MGVRNIRVLVTSLLAHNLNTNSAIRNYVEEGFIELLGPESVVSCPLELTTRYVAEFRPTLIIGVGSLAQDQSDLRGLRRSADGVEAVLAYWLHDDPYEFDYAFKAELYADVIYSNDSWAAHHYRHPRVHLLPLAASRSVHYRPLAPVDVRDIDLFFCGVAYPNRIDVLQKAESLLSKRAVAVFGADWPSDLSIATNRRLSAADVADHAARAKLTLNLGRDISIANQHFALPAATPGPRTFEIALSGSAQLYFVSNLGILDMFEKDEEIILVDSARDIDDAISRAHARPEEIYAIAERAQKRALQEHTYANRARRILETSGAGKSAAF
jgi:spore maturation protein CgeB